jgi:hypothetical protein
MIPHISPSHTCTAKGEVLTTTFLDSGKGICIQAASGLIYHLDIHPVLIGVRAGIWEWFGCFEICVCCEVVYYYVVLLISAYFEV